MKWALTLLALCVALSSTMAASPFEWTKRDSWDFYNKKFTDVTAENCATKTEDELIFAENTVSMMPKSNELLDVSTRVFRNRTCLLALHDIALSRSFFYSFLNKYLNETEEWYEQPGWMYYYWRQASYVFGYPHCVNSSSVFYDFNMSYPNWMSKVPINTTIELFGPRVYRQDNTYYTWMREPDLNSAVAVDYGTGINRNYTSPNFKPHPWYTLWLPDFTRGSDKNKGSYTVGLKMSNTPGTYTSDVFQGFTFFGPPLTSISDDTNLPVKFTHPYFDCQGKAEWMLSAVAPIVDHVPRYRPWIEQVEFGETPPKFVGVVTVDTDWNTIDINPCPKGEGNPESAFSGTARCKEKTTMCQPLTGWGFARGSYECPCRPGYRLPKEQSGWFQGAEIELATEYEYANGFDCIPIGYMHVVPSVNAAQNENTMMGLIQDTGDPSTQKDVNTPTGDSNNILGGQRRKKREAEGGEKKVEKREAAQSEEMKLAELESLIEKETEDDRAAHTKRSVRARSIKSDFVDRKEDERVLKEVYGSNWLNMHNAAKRKKREATHSRIKTGVVDEAAIDRMEGIFDHIAQVSQTADCTKIPANDLHLPGDVSYGANEQFEYQGRTALSLAHFLSGFYQSNKDAMRHGVVDGDRVPNPIQLHTEVLTNVIADHKIVGLGIYFEEDMYEEQIGNKLRVRSLFAPYAFKQNDEYRTVDLAGDPNIGYYLKEDWFRKSKMRWASNTDTLTMFELRPYVRSNVNGTEKLSETQIFPVEYYTALYEDGQWSSPYFACNGYVDDWVMSYTVPFFDRTEFTPLRFKGVVKVDVKMSYLDINQCSQAFYVANAFKDTARCDYVTTFCVPVEGKRMQRGAYRCQCKQGYEYQFVENAWFFDGQLLEEEYSKMMRNDVSKFEHMKCRTAGASAVTPAAVLFILSTVVCYFTTR